ncbi:MAG: glutamate racemase [Elusimicrobiota bacterium]|jgi:glutamate racemase|nr:glutamate racemase [Elusimicrobiota bacterium]
MKSDDRAIGIFDSGLGGLTILKEVRKILPKENIIYFGDTAHVPYGSKSKETVTTYSLDIASFLESKKVKMILIACNTASALSLEAVKKHIKVPVLGVITPGAKRAAAASKNKKILVLGTESTVKSQAYPKHIKQIDKTVDTAQRACPLFVPIIEEGLLEGNITDAAIRHYLEPAKIFKADTVILGCTHYPVIKKRIARIFGKNVTLVDSAQEIAKETKSLLTKNACLKTSGKAKVHIYASDSPDRFAKLSARIIGGKIPKVRIKKLNI